MPTTPRPIARLCVFCGASSGTRPSYAAEAQKLGEEMAQRRITLVYGGGRAGLMGAVADAALGKGGQVVGVITRLLQNKELEHKGVTSLHVVETMHERKMMMANMADAFIALPGGLGTLDELFEILAWAQLGIHRKPIGLLNTDGFYNSLSGFLDQIEGEGFLRLDHRKTLLSESDPVRLIDRLSAL
jgi:uncharacterized protein (TIGR00730 family)